MPRSRHSSRLVNELRRRNEKLTAKVQRLKVDDMMTRTTLDLVEEALSGMGLQAFLRLSPTPHVEIVRAEEESHGEDSEAVAEDAAAGEGGQHADGGSEPR